MLMYTLRSLCYLACSIKMIRLYKVAIAACFWASVSGQVGVTDCAVGKISPAILTAYRSLPLRVCLHVQNAFCRNVSNQLSKSLLIILQLPCVADVNGTNCAPTQWPCLCPNPIYIDRLNACVYQACADVESQQGQ